MDQDVMGELAERGPSLVDLLSTEDTAEVPAEFEPARLGLLTRPVELPTAPPER